MSDDPQTILVRAGDTEPLEITVDATGLENLDSLNAAGLYLREEDASANHVTNGTLVVADSAAKRLSFNPVGQKVGGGDALDEPGVYIGYVRIEWTDGDITRHPGDPALDLRVVVHANLE